MSREFVHIYNNAELILNTLPLGQPNYLSDGEIERTSVTLLSEMPLARAWGFWTARSGFQGI